MLTYPNIDPVALQISAFEIFGKTIGPLKIHWYGLMYLFGFIGAWSLGVYRAKRPWSPIQKSQVEDLVFYTALGVILGARIGYILFYNFGDFLKDPIELFKVWHGGMSFHGGLLGVIIAMYFYGKKINRSFLEIADFSAPLVPIGLGLGRIGNFIGGELWGRATDVPWGMIFPKDVDQLVRHPSQLYQAFFEGLVLFVILFWFSRKPRPKAAVASLFVLLYGCFRFMVEFVREPDAHIQFDLFGWMTRGQELCVPMIIIGGWIFYSVYLSKLLFNRDKAPASEKHLKKSAQANK